METFRPDMVTAPQGRDRATRLLASRMEQGKLLHLRFIAPCESKRGTAQLAPARWPGSPWETPHVLPLRAAGSMATSSSKRRKKPSLLSYLKTCTHELPSSHFAHLPAQGSLQSPASCPGTWLCHAFTQRLGGPGLQGSEGSLGVLSTPCSYPSPSSRLLVRVASENEKTIKPYLFPNSLLLAENGSAADSIVSLHLFLREALPFPSTLPMLRNNPEAHQSLSLAGTKAWLAHASPSLSPGTPLLARCQH